MLIVVNEVQGKKDFKLHIMSKEYLNTKEIAELLGVNEKIIYQLINEKGLPACKVTGKWLFPKHLVDIWIENHVINKPVPVQGLLSSMLIIIGSHDPLLEAVLSFYNRHYQEYPVVYSASGSMFGIKALKKGLCHIATSHLIHKDEKEYNFDYLREYFENDIPAVINFCFREQGIIVKKGNPKGIKDIPSLVEKGAIIANRPEGTGTRLLLDHELNKAGINPSELKGYENEFSSHIDVGIEVLSGRADAGIGIRAVASMLGLDFVPLRWERYDFLIPKSFFFEKNIQRLLGILQDKEFKRIVQKFDGYNIESSGRILFPKE